MSPLMIDLNSWSESPSGIVSGSDNKTGLSVSTCGISLLPAACVASLHGLLLLLEGEQTNCLGWNYLLRSRILNKIFASN